MSGTDYAAPAFAVVGMSGRFPGAENPLALWTNLRAGTESITFFSDEELLAAGESPEQLRDPAYVKASGRLANIDKFDAAFFGMSPRDAAVFDPQHRVFLECAWEAFEDAGYVAERFDGPVGVFAASGGAEYLMHNLLPNRQVMESVGAWLVRHTGNDPNFLATRVSYELDLNGPSMSIQTACSSSLAAVHVACQSLLNGECDMALAGGSTIYPEQNRGYLYKEGEILSPDGHCRAFDANSAGTVMASAVGCVVIRRLEDAMRDGDRVLAIIRGSAINNDGSQKVGYLAPSVTGQARVVSEALAISGIHPEDVSYIEAHGTGTLIGDPIEITALTQAFRAETDKQQFCAIGSLKTNLGHTGEASGICGFIKTVLALQHREIPPSLHFDTPNPQADLPNSPFFVNTRLRDWTVPAGKARIAGVTSLGAGGTNVHVLLEEAPRPLPVEPSRSHQLLVLSARTSTALDAATGNLAAHLRANPELDLADQAFTLLAGRKRFAHRRAVVVKDAADGVAALEAPDQRRLITQHRKQDQAPSIFFMFPGGGAQYVSMGADLYGQEPVYRAAFDEALSHLEPVLRGDVRALVLGVDAGAASALLEAPSRALPALLATEYAITRLLSAWGIAPAAMIGHSAGEYAAACLAGVITLRETMTLVALRGRLFETLPDGGMLSVSLTPEAAREFMGPELACAAINAPSSCVLSGPVAAIATAEARIRARDIECTRVHINVAAHSAMVDPILAEFERFCRTIRFQHPRVPFISNVTGDWIADDEATDPAYWVRHLRSTVRFGDGLQKLVESSEGVFCEIGPGRTLSGLLRRHAGKIAAVTPTMRHPREAGSDLAFLLGGVGRLWASGVPLEERRFLGEKRRRAFLPSYPFERQRYWVDPDKSAPDRAPSTALRKNPDLGEWFYAPSWARSAPPASDVVGERYTWLVFTDDESALAGASIRRLRGAGHTVIEVVPAERFTAFGNLRYGVNPAVSLDFEALAKELRARELLPQRALHLWALAPRAGRGSLLRKKTWDPLDTYDRGLSLHYFSLIFFVRAFAPNADALRLFCVSSHLQSVPGDGQTHPEKAVLLGASKVIPREYPQVVCTSIDVVLPGTPADQKQLTDRLLRELEGHSVDREVALRGTERWIRRFDPVRLEPVEPKPWLRDGGVYVVTGGLGGIGLQVAEHLARSGHVKLVLIGRTPLPPEERSTAWLAEHGPNDETSRKIVAVRAMRALGSEVMTIAADVTDLPAMRAAVAEVRARFGAVHGVFHAAGVLRNELIALRGTVAESAVIEPKMKGALVLDTVLAANPPELFVLFSSVSSILGLPGQADYTAANAFLDAFAEARARRCPGRTLSIDWNAWQDVGMLAGHHETPHPALEAVVSDSPAGTVFRTSFRRKDTWLLDDHVVRGGDALIPGTGFLEIARAALEYHSESRPVELRDVVFLAPFAVPPEGERSLDVRIDRSGDQEFTCYAESDANPLVVGKAAYVDAPSPSRIDLDAIRRRCKTRGEIANGQLVQHFMEFGRRWACLQGIELGDREALVSLELPAVLAGDLDVYRLHPAMLDLATGAAQTLVPGFDAQATFLVPFSYERVLIRRALTSRVFSHVRLREGGSSDSVVFDATLYDDQGEELVVVEGFTMRRAAPAFLAAAPVAINAARSSRNRPESVTTSAIREGMTPAEGLEALDRILAVEFSPQVVACTVPLQPWLDHLAEEARGTDAASTDAGVPADLPVFARTGMGTAFAAPRTPIERELAGLWSALLGVADVGIHDDFFELGGNSLTAVRLFAKIKKKFDVDLSLDTLFRAPTIATCAQLVSDELGVPSGIEPEGPATNRADTPATTATGSDVWSPLVPIQLSGAGSPFFCVHGAMGNVLNLRALAQRFGQDRPFYALQAQGVDGKLRPLETIEQMATQYITAIRQVQPRGPYLLGGFSGGGVIAFEMAQQLRCQSEETAIVALLDTFSPLVPSRRYSRGERIARLAKNGPGYVLEQIRWRQSARRYQNQLREVDTYHARGLVVPLELRETQLFSAYMEAQKRYQPQIYPGRLTLFRAKDIQAHNAHAGAFLGWDGLAADGIDVHEMPGGHDDFVLEPHVFALVTELKTCLARADSLSDASALTARQAEDTNNRELAIDAA